MNDGVLPLRESADGGAPLPVVGAPISALAVNSEISFGTLIVFFLTCDALPDHFPVAVLRCNS